MSIYGRLATVSRDARTDNQGVPLALATLIQVEGSSYRQPGARLLVDAEGRILAGSVSGGCLEGDLAARAGAVCASGVPIRLTYDLRADLESIWGLGAACDGVAHLLLEPLQDASWFAAAERIRSGRQDGAVVTWLTAHGGRTALLVEGHPASRTVRTLHSDASDLPWDAVRAAVEVAQRTNSTVYQPLNEQGALLVEPLTAPVALHCVGAGRGAEAFATIAHTLGWPVTVIDHRPALLDTLQVPDGTHRLAVSAGEDPAAVLAQLAHDGRTAVALLSHQFDVDAAWLEAALPSAVGYLGVLGSRARSAQLLERVAQALAARGTPLTARMTKRLHAPIGLDLGGESPASIALSAIAEIEAVLHARPAGFLRDRQAPIHTRTPTPRRREDTLPVIGGDGLVCDLPGR
jgi:xanthine/CO dehydrogenase XdhC/CoxF family maturation factor